VDHLQQNGNCIGADGLYCSLSFDRKRRRPNDERVLVFRPIDKPFREGAALEVRFFSKNESGRQQTHRNRESKDAYEVQPFHLAKNVE